MNDLILRDAKHLWHPFTWQGAAEPIPIERGEGAWLIQPDGTRILDGISSWWAVTHGHACPEISARIAAQLEKIHHVMFAGFTHAPAIELAERLLALLPENQTRVFYVDNGATAVEAALKIAIQGAANRGEKRTKFLALEGGYHGDTFGAMSVGARAAFTAPFADHLFETAWIDVPIQNPETSLHQIRAHLAEGNVAGFIFEPLVQGAGGMRIYPAEHLDALLTECRNAGVPTIADEVMTGFGRTGTMFASDRLRVKPDLICLSKGLTGGTLPMGAVTCTEELYQTFYTGDRMKAFFHGHTFSASPIACAAALASLDLFEAPACRQGMARIQARHRAFAPRLAAHSAVRDVRVLGTLLAFDVVPPGSSGESSYFHPVKDRLQSMFLERGILLRPLGNVLYILPPYCIADNELEQIETVILEVLNLV